MDQAERERGARPSSGRRASNADVDSVIELFSALGREIPGMWNDRVELMTLELQRVGAVFLHLMWTVLAFALLAMTLWLACCLGAAWALLAHDWNWMWVLLLIAAVHVLALAALMFRMKALFPGLSLPATRRHWTWPGTETADAAPSE